MIATAYDPHPSLMTDVPAVYQLHAAIPSLLYAVSPSSRLLHVWTILLAYIERPYILYRTRHTSAGR